MVEKLKVRPNKVHLKQHTKLYNMQTITCPRCKGEGDSKSYKQTLKKKECEYCDGSGTQKNLIGGGIIICPRCKGEGERMKKAYRTLYGTCRFCKGTGSLTIYHNRPIKTCSECSGAGCTNCMYIGIDIKPRQGDKIKCDKCSGIGKLRGSYLSSCSDCDGTGLRKNRVEGESIICLKCKGECKKKITGFIECDKCERTGFTIFGDSSKID